MIETATLVKTSIPSKTKTMNIGPKAALQILTNCKYDKQRPIREWHVDDLANFMCNGTFTPTNIIAMCRLNGEYLLANGQHTLSAVVKSGQSYNFTVQEYDCNSQDEVAAIYSRFDIHMRRTEADIFNSMDVCQKLGLTKTERTLLSGAIRVIAKGFKSSSSRNDYRFNNKDFVLSLMTEWLAPLKKVVALIDGGERIAREILHRRHILAVCMWIVRYSKDQDAAAEFIRGFAMNDGLRRGDPRKIAMDDIHKLRSDVENLYAFCGAWNSFYRKEWDGGKERSTRQSISRYANYMVKWKRANISGTKQVFEIVPERVVFSVGKAAPKNNGVSVIRKKVGRRITK
jgi:hypothetical protein